MQICNALDCLLRFEIQWRLDWSTAYMAAAEEEKKQNKTPRLSQLTLSYFTIVLHCCVGIFFFYSIISAYNSNLATSLVDLKLNKQTKIPNKQCQIFITKDHFAYTEGLKFESLISSKYMLSYNLLTFFLFYHNVNVFFPPNGQTTSCSRIEFCRETSQWSE